MAKNAILRIKFKKLSVLGPQKLIDTYHLMPNESLAASFGTIECVSFSS